MDKIIISLLKEMKIKKKNITIILVQYIQKKSSLIKYIYGESNMQKYFRNLHLFLNNWNQHEQI